MWLPFRLGQDYGQEGYQAGEHRFDWWWYDKNWWEKRLERLRAEGLNGITFWNVHPFPLFIRFKKFPEAAFFSEKETACNIAHFHWLIDKAAEYGLAIVLMEYMIHCSPGFGCRHHVPFGKGRGWGGKTDTPLLRAYNRYCHEELFRTYPRLGGLMTCWEAAKDNASFLTECIVDVMNKLPRKPDLFIRLWGAHFPEDIVRLVKSYRGKSILCEKMSQENIFKPLADTRFVSWRKETGAPMMAILGPGNATGKNVKGLLWTEPEFTAKLLADARCKGIEGIGYFAGFDNWIGRGIKPPREPMPKEQELYAKVMRLEEEAVGYYALRPFEKYKPGLWIEKAGGYYGLPHREASLLFKAMKTSSGISPRYCTLVDRDYGFPFGVGGLMSVIGRFTNYSNADFKGDFRLGGPYAYPFHTWGERINSITDYCRQPKAKGTNPPEIAGELEGMANETLACLKKIKDRSATSGLVKYIRLNALFGLSAARTIMAGVYLYSSLFSKNKEEALTRIEKGIKNLSLSLARAREFTRLAANIPLVEQMEQYYPREIRDSIPLVQAELKKYRLLVQCLKTTKIPFTAVSRYWLAWDNYNRLQNYIRDDHHIESARIRQAEEKLSLALNLAAESLRAAAGFEKTQENINQWLAYLKEEKKRIEIPVINCTPTTKDWYGLLYNGSFLPPLRLEDQLLSVFIPRKIYRQSRFGYFGTKPVIPSRLEFKIFHDQNGFYLVLRDFEVRHGIGVFFDPGHSKQHYYRYDFNLRDHAVTGSFARLIAPHGLKYEPIDARAIKIETKGNLCKIFFPWSAFGLEKKIPEKWGLNIVTSAGVGIYAFSSMLGAVGAPARFAKLALKKGKHKK